MKYTVFKVIDYPYMIKCSTYATKSEATSAAEWAEEHGQVHFIVKQTN